MRVRIRRAQVADKNQVYQLAGLFVTGAQPMTRDDFTVVFETMLIERDFEASVVFVAEAVDAKASDGQDGEGQVRDAGHAEVDVDDVISDAAGQSGTEKTAIQPGQILGYSLMAVSRLLHASGLSGHLHEIVVAPEARGRGVGEALIQTNERYAARRGVRQISAYTAHFGSFYSQLGYEIVGQHYRKFLNTW